MDKTCANKDCKHEPEAHHREYVSSPDGVPRPVYFACLVLHCSCEKYKKPSKAGGT